MDYPIETFTDEERASSPPISPTSTGPFSRS